MKFHLRKKFRRAVAYARVLQKTCADRTEQQTALEASSYCAFLEGMYYFEVEKWDEAQAAFMTCRSIYSQILKVSDSMQAILYKEKLEQIDQSMRYCSYRSKKQPSLMTMENLLDLKQQIKVLYTLLTPLGPRTSAEDRGDARGQPPQTAREERRVIPYRYRVLLLGCWRLSTMGRRRRSRTAR